MLRVEWRALDDGPLNMAGSIPPAELGFRGAEAPVREPVRISGRLSNAGSGQYFWRGQLEAVTHLQCRRCLGGVARALDCPVDVLFVQNGESEDTGVYAIEADAPVLDLTDMVHEELMLAMPEWVLCKETCRGLCAGCGTDLNLGPCECTPATDPRWAALKALETDPVQEGS